MPNLFKLLEQNRQWADDIAANDPTYFPQLAAQQHPEYLWIGCSDSRVPANVITGLMPGQVFVHRNIANLCVHTDLNVLSVLQYAVEVLRVKHIMVVGHYGCGGIKAATETNRRHGLIDNWLRHIQDVESRFRYELSDLKEEKSSKEPSSSPPSIPPDRYLDRLCELNVMVQAQNVSRTPILRQAWENGQQIDIHSWIYSLRDGHLHPVLQEPLNAPYEYCPLMPANAVMPTTAVLSPFQCVSCQKEDPQLSRKNVQDDHSTDESTKEE